jgi:hypothetical protein
VISFALAALVMAAPAETPTLELQRPALLRRTPFDAGSIHVTFGSALLVGERDDRYFVIAAGLGYYIINGLELGLDVEHWFGNDPEVTRVSPQVRYTFFQIFERFPPYLGAFYRRWVVHGGEDKDSAGLRAGAYLLVGRSATLGLGVTYETLLPCDDADCDATYPEVTLGIGF